MSKELQTLTKIQQQNRQLMNGIVEGLSKCQRHYAKNKDNKVFEDYYIRHIQGDIHKFYEACTDIVGGEFDEMLREFDGKISIDIYKEDDDE